MYCIWLCRMRTVGAVSNACKTTSHIPIHFTHTHTPHTTEGDRSLGMVIVSGKVMNKDGSSVEGIFIQKILPGSLTDKDGR